MSAPPSGLLHPSVSIPGHVYDALQRRARELGLTCAGIVTSLVNEAIDGATPDWTAKVRDDSVPRLSRYVNIEASPAICELFADAAQRVRELEGRDVSSDELFEIALIKAMEAGMRGWS